MGDLELYEYLHERYYYENGRLFFKKDLKNQIKAGDEAGNQLTKYAEDGSIIWSRWVMKVNRKHFYRATVIWVMFNKQLPPKDFEVDHIDRNSLNDKIENLRLVTRTNNVRNRGKMRKNPSSKYIGVCWNKSHKKWVARIGGYKRVYLGSFKDEKEAALAYDKAVKELHGEFAVLNFSND